ncbi:MAG: hypothetical protein IJR66_04135 [Clostridia bacterium]|nr:hypothetical protein [Clostridia bacterium]
MKKKPVSIIAFLLVLIMCITFASGCKTFTKNNERDTNQVVATVKLNEDAPTDKVYKKDLIMAYMNYGYYYSYQGYSNEEVYELIVNSLVENRILIQNALIKFNEGVAPFNDKVTDTTKGAFDVERYLTNVDEKEGDKIIKLSDVNEAKYNTLKNINTLIENYVVDTDEEQYVETLSNTVRTAPTNASKADLTPTEKLQYIVRGVLGLDTKKDVAKYRKAYLKTVQLLEDNALWGENVNDIKSSIYYLDSLKSEEESILLTRYQNIIKDEQRNKVSYEDLENLYLAMYNEQVASFSVSESDYSSALSSQTADKPVVYNPYNGYGYVYNLLLGIDDIQSTQVKELTGTDGEKVEARRNIFKGITIKDLRDTWILSGYDFDYETKKFTGDYALAEDSLEFKGDVTLIKEANKENNEDAQYIVKSKSYNLDEFIDMMEEYVYGAKQEGDHCTDYATGSIYRKVQINDEVEDYDKKIEELIFAFSTDSGSLNSYKGYLISPKPPIGGSETYMQEFADAGRELIDGSMGEYSYIIVATDYGYHVMFFSEIVDGKNYPTLTDYLASLGIDDGKALYDTLMATWNDEDVDSDCFLYKFIDANTGSMTSNALSESNQAVIERYKNDSKCVNINKKVYKDLIK